jgi:hypothetical protein
MKHVAPRPAATNDGPGLGHGASATSRYDRDNPYQRGAGTVVQKNSKLTGIQSRAGLAQEQEPNAPAVTREAEE